MTLTELNVGFSKRELKILTRAGYSAALHEKTDGWHVFLYDTGTPRSDVIALGTAAVRIDAIRDAISQAQALPRCACGSSFDTRWRTCVRCGANLEAA